MGYGQAEQSDRRKGKAVQRQADQGEEDGEEVPKKVLFRRGERVAIGASGGKGELAIFLKCPEVQASSKMTGREGQDP